MSNPQQSIADRARAAEAFAPEAEEKFRWANTVRVQMQQAADERGAVLAALVEAENGGRAEELADLVMAELARRQYEAEQQ